MPLSEDEQRILRQIEEQLQRDPSFTRELIPEPRSSRRGFVAWTAAAVVCVAITVLLLGFSPYLAFAAFGAGVFSAVRAERHLRALGDEAMRHVASMRRQMPGTGRRPTDG